MQNYNSFHLFWYLLPQGDMKIQPVPDVFAESIDTIAKSLKLAWISMFLQSMLCDAICGLSLLLVLSFAPRGFSPGTLVFPSPQKPTFPNSKPTRNQVDEEPLRGCATSKLLFIIYLFI